MGVARGVFVVGYCAFVLIMIASMIDVSPRRGDHARRRR
jgi:hypothetical protein